MKLPLRLLRILILALLPGALAAATPGTDSRVAGAIQAEQARIAALTADDHAALDRLLAPEMIYTHSNAVVDDKTQFIASLTSGRLKYKSIEHSDQKARVYGDAVLLTNLTRVQSVSEGQDIRVTLRTTILYVKKDGQWQFVAWHSTLVP
jgi:hypothetical protein